jgi:hypothetical protein
MFSFIHDELDDELPDCTIQMTLLCRGCGYRFSGHFKLVQDREAAYPPIESYDDDLLFDDDEELDIKEDRYVQLYS